MSARYIPPHLRDQSRSNDEASTKAVRDPDEGYTLEELANQFDCKHTVGTLNSNAKMGVDWDPSSLAFIVIFEGQHPGWPPKIFCKSHLNLLPGFTTLPDPDETDENGANDAKVVCQDLSGQLCKPIAVFTDVPPPRPIRSPADKRYVFIDYFHITSVNYLAPQSKELIDMLDLKFTPEGKRRSAAAWVNSFFRMWAIVHLGKANDEGVKKGNPMVPLKEIKRKTVTEVLEELRVHDEQQAMKQWENVGRKAHGKNGGDEPDLGEAGASKEINKDASHR